MSQDTQTLKRHTQWDSYQVNRFVEALREVLSQLTGRRDEVATASNRRLCELCEGLHKSQMYGLWRDVASYMGDKTNTKVAKHYHNSFKKHLYSERLTARDKTRIGEFAEAELRRGTSQKTIVSALVKTFENEGRDVFPNEIKSFAYQEIRRIKRRSAAATCPERDTDESSGIHSSSADFQNEITPLSQFADMPSHSWDSEPSLEEDE